MIERLWFTLLFERKPFDSTLYAPGDGPDLE
jgi:hypothetical protein